MSNDLEILAGECEKLTVRFASFWRITLTPHRLASGNGAQQTPRSIKTVLDHDDLTQAIQEARQLINKYTEHLLVEERMK